jgi:hypothetical protein
VTTKSPPRQKEKPPVETGGLTNERICKFQENLEFYLDKENLECYHQSTIKLGKDGFYGQREDFGGGPQ